jgi:hypothetical protein
LLSPETEAEAELLKQIMKQDNDLIELRSSVVLLNKSFQRGILIAKKSTKLEPKTEDNGDKTQT